MAKVYVVQDTKTVNRHTGKLESKFDFRPAEEFGEIEYLLDSAASPFNLDSAVAQLKAKLSSFGPEDSLLLVGSPVLIGVAVAIAADINGGDVKMLQWSGTKRAYIQVSGTNVFCDCDHPAVAGQPYP